MLRSLGLMDMTECALRTRAYRRQVPFHLNGRRILFTLGDLREIAEGETCPPPPRTHAATPGATPRPTTRRRPAPQHSASTGDRWRARAPRGRSGKSENGHHA